MVIFTQKCSFAQTWHVWLPNFTVFMTERQKELSAKAPKGKEVDLPLARHSRPSPVKTMVLSRSGSRSSNSTLDMSKIADSARKSEEISCRTKSMANEVVVPSKRVGQRLVGTRFFPFLPRLCPSSPCCLSLIHIWRCRRLPQCRSRWSPYH